MPKKVVKKAGCVPVRRHEGKPDGDWEVLLVSSRQTSNTWVFPKGGVEKDEKHKDAAARETEEEAGVVGDMTKGSLGKFEYSRGGNLIRQKMWLLFVTRQHSDDSKRWKERKKRGREWMSLSDARVRLVQGDLNGARPELISILDAAVARLERLRLDPNAVADDDDDDDEDGEEEQQQEETSE